MHGFTSHNSSAQIQLGSSEQFNDKPNGKLATFEFHFNQHCLDAPSTWHAWRQYLRKPHRISSHKKHCHLIHHVIRIRSGEIPLQFLPQSEHFLRQALERRHENSTKEKLISTSKHTHAATYSTSRSLISSKCMQHRNVKSQPGRWQVLRRQEQRLKLTKWVQDQLENLLPSWSVS